MRGSGGDGFVVPALADAPAPPAPPTAPALPIVRPRAEPSLLRPISYGVGGTAAVAIAVGAIAGAVAWSAQSEADKGCTGDVCRTHEALDADERAHTWATVSTLGFVAGAVLAVSAVVLFVVSGQRSPRDASVRPASLIVSF